MSRLIRRSSWPSLATLRSDINELFEPFSELSASESGLQMCDWMPNIDIKEDDNHYIIHADIPGVDPKDIDVHMENNMLTIKGVKESKTEDKSNDYVRVERSKGTFLRRFSLPNTVGDDIKAKSKHGVLEVTIPKANKNTSKKIEVES